jgi:hypothetical protein
MRSSTCRLLLALAIAACGGGGSDGPTDPGNGNGNGFDVSGNWRVTATVIETTCPDIDLGEEEMQVVVIEHEGDQITFIVEGLGSVTGTIDVQTGEFVIDVNVFVPGQGSLRLQESGQFTSETRYTSEETVTFEDVAIACHFRTMDEGARIST